MRVATISTRPGTNILDIRSSKTRDIVRGLLARNEDANVHATFSHLMKSVSAEDLITVDNVIRNSGLFAHLRLRPEFPIQAVPFIEDSDLSYAPRPHLRPAYILHRAAQNAPLLARALEQMHALNEAIFNDNIQENFPPEHIGEFGHSLLLARKLAFIFGHTEKEQEGWKIASDTLSSYGLNANNYGVVAIVDSIGFDFSYLGLKSNFDAFSSLDERATTPQKISYLSFNAVQRDPSLALEALAANYSVSLLDAVHYLLCHRSLGIFDSSLKFDVRVENAWTKIQDGSLNYQEFFNTSDSSCDLQAFRSAPAFLENERFRNFRMATQFYFDTPDSRSKWRSAPNPFEDNFYSIVEDVRDLLPTGDPSFDSLPDAFDQTTAGMLSRSCGLAKIADRDPDFSQLNSSEMARLMGLTTDVDKLLSVAALRHAASTAGDPLVALILQTLLRAQSPATRDSYSFKQMFQDYVNSVHSADIISFLVDINDKSPEIVGYYASLLDETLLSQLPFLVKKAEDVYETRARILEWHGEITGEETSKQKAKQLRIDRKIASVRGQINETRLNIDPLRFRQWIEVSKLSEFSAFVRQPSRNIPLSIDTSKKSLAELRLAGHRDPNLRAAAAIMDCYKEFCTNADFGVASYLGRRIRHGTLRGTLLDGLPSVEEYELSQAAKSQYLRWLKTFEQSTDAIASKLHFVGKGSTARAVISPEIDNKEKADVVLASLHQIFDQSQADQGVLGIPLLIEQSCWFIFEIELRGVQAAVLESRNEYGTFKFKNIVGSYDELSFEKALNIALSAQFATVASWFKKPPNISPVAEVGEIINVVLREARAEFSSYNPKLQIRSGGDLELSGLVYYHVYDALSIIVRNAAKHGAHPGAVLISAKSEDRPHGAMLRIEVATPLKDKDSAAEAVERMRLAGQAGPINADVVEGLSGVRKLQKMKLDKAIADFDAKASQAGDGCLVVSVLLPLTGVV